MLKLLRAEQNLLGSFFELMYNMLKGDKAMDKIVLSEYNECKRYILDELEKMSLPKEHPFLKYPRMQITLKRNASSATAERLFHF